MRRSPEPSPTTISHQSFLQYLSSPRQPSPNAAFLSSTLSTPMSFCSSILFCSESLHPLFLLPNLSLGSVPPCTFSMPPPELLNEPRLGYGPSLVSQVSLPPSCQLRTSTLTVLRNGGLPPSSSQNSQHPSLSSFRRL